MASGEIDLGTAGQLADALRGALAILPPSGSLVVDLTGVTFLDCSGLDPLLMVRRQLGDRFWLMNPPARVLRLLDLAGLSDAFAVLEGPATMPQARGAADHRTLATTPRPAGPPATAWPPQQSAGEAADTLTASS